MRRRIMITGASSGIGRAVAVEMARRGHAVGLAARNTAMLEAVQEEIQAVAPSPRFAARELDVRNYTDVPTAVSEIAEQLGGLDTLFANAGIGLGEKIGGGFEKARMTIETNLVGAIATVDAGVSYFLEQGHGHIVGTCSVAAFRGMPRSSSYGASKAGFAVYLEALRAEVYRKNIDVTVLYPGYIDTPLNDMLPSRPFLITVEKGASLIADMIEKNVKSSTVPAWPWAVVGRLLKYLPTAVVARL